MQDKNIQTETYIVKIHKYIKTNKSIHKSIKACTASPLKSHFYVPRAASKCHGAGYVGNSGRPVTEIADR